MVGAGTGRLWLEIDHRGRGLDVTLADFSAAMCDQLRTIPGAAVRQCDAASLPFADASFDTVLANHMLYHLDDPEVALLEFRRVLRPGGRLAIAVNGADHLAELKAIGPVIGRPDLVTAAERNRVTAETATTMIDRHFDDVGAERYPCDLEVPTAEPILAYLESLSDAPLTPDQRSATADLVQAKIDAEGSYRVKKCSVLITASR